MGYFRWIILCDMSPNTRPCEGWKPVEQLIKNAEVDSKSHRATKDRGYWISNPTRSLKPLAVMDFRNGVLESCWFNFTGALLDRFYERLLDDLAPAVWT